MGPKGCVEGAALGFGDPAKTHPWALWSLLVCLLFVLSAFLKILSLCAVFIISCFVFPFAPHSFRLRTTQFDLLWSIVGPVVAFVMSCSVPQFFLLLSIPQEGIWLTQRISQDRQAHVALTEVIYLLPCDHRWDWLGTLYHIFLTRDPSYVISWDIVRAKSPCVPQLIQLLSRSSITLAHFTDWSKLPYSRMALTEWKCVVPSCAGAELQVPGQALTTTAVDPSSSQPPCHALPDGSFSSWEIVHVPARWLPQTPRRQKCALSRWQGFHVTCGSMCRCDICQLWAAGL